jgi:acetolactate synthase-1/2/3 large subunit
LLEQTKHPQRLMPQVRAKIMGDRKAWFDQINAWKKKWPPSA